MSNIDEEFDVEPQRITNAKTASQIARERALEKAGLTLDWYREHVEASRNSNGEPCCESCGQPEKKKFNGKVKDLVVSAKDKKIICQACANKNYRQSQRDRVAKRQDREGLPTLQEFWVRNRNKLSEAEKVKYESRHDDVVLLLEELEAVNRVFEKQDRFDEAALQAFVREICTEVLDFGTVQTDIAAIPFFKPEYADFYQSYTNPEDKPYDKALALYMTYGYVTSLPEHAVYQFFVHVERHLGLPVSSLETYTVRIGRIYDVLDYGKIWQQPDQIIKCSTKGCKESTTFPPMVHKFEPRDDDGNFRLVTENIPPSQWFCAPCQTERDNKARAAHAHIIDVHLEQRRNDAVTDPYGRPKDKPLWLKEKIWGGKTDDKNTVYDDGGEYRG